MPGASRLNASPIEKWLVTKWKKNTASSVIPKIAQVVGWVKAPISPSRNTADRAPHDVLAGPRKANNTDRMNRMVMSSR